MRDIWVVLIFSAIGKFLIISIQDYLTKTRPDWTIAGHASQVVLTVSQIYWCKDLTLCLTGDGDKNKALHDFLQVIVALNQIRGTKFRMKQLAKLLVFLMFQKISFTIIFMTFDWTFLAKFSTSEPNMHLTE